MFVIIKSIFIVLAASTVNASNHTKRVCLSNQKYEVQPSLINLHPNEYNHELHYYPFVVKLDKCAGSCHTWIKNFNKIYHAKNHIKDHIKECNSDQCGISVNVYASVKNAMYVKKIIFGIQLHVVKNI